MDNIKILDQHGRPMMSNAYRGARTGRELGTWNPPLRSADADLLPAINKLMARSNDLSRNYAQISGAIQIQLDNIVGSGLRLSAKPDYKLLNKSADWAAEWSRDTEQKFRNWADNPACYIDASRRLTFGGMIGLGYRHFLTSGEILASSEWINNPNSNISTAIQMIDPARLSNPYEKMDNTHLKKGVYLNNYTAPIGYSIREAMESDAIYGTGSYKWKKVQKQTAWGRAQIIHIFEQERAGQTRGKSGLASVIAKSKMLERFQDASLESAIINSMFSATIKTDFNYSQVAEILGSQSDAFELSDKILAQKADFYSDKLSLDGGARVTHLLPNEELDLKSPQNPGPNFAEFEKSTLKNLAAGLNITYEQLARDYSDTNYSGARAGLMESWKFFTTKRHLIAGRFATEIYLLWLEEAISSGLVDHPYGSSTKTLGKEKWAVGRCQWIGPGKGHIDPLKESRADQLEMQMGTKTLENACAERGQDWEEVMEQQEREELRKLEVTARRNQRIKELGLENDTLESQAA